MLGPQGRLSRYSLAVWTKQQQLLNEHFESGANLQTTAVSLSSSATNDYQPAAAAVGSGWPRAVALLLLGVNFIAKTVEHILFINKAP